MLLKVNCYLTTRGTYDPLVLNSIKSQTLPFEFEILSNVFDDKEKNMCIIKSKEACFDKAEKSDCEFVIIHEDDCIELFTDNFENMLKFLIANESYGAVALRRTPHPITTHVCCGVMMIRKDFIKDKNMFSGNVGHICYDLINYFKTKGVGYGYIDKRQHLQQVESCKK